MRSVKLAAAVLGVVTCLALAAAPAGALTFTPPAHYQVGGHPADLASGDFNGDGLLDIGRPPLICVLCGHVEGVYLTPTYLPAGRIASAVIVDDFNGDGKDDFATSDSRAGSVSVRIKGTVPVIDTVSPAKGRVGATITLAGRHFRKYRRTGFVRFGGTVATDYLSWSDHAIRVRVPRGTTKGLVKVTVTSIIGPSAAKPFARL